MIQTSLTRNLNLESISKAQKSEGCMWHENSRS